MQDEYHPQALEKASNQAESLSWNSWDSWNSMKTTIQSQPDSTPFQALADGIRLALSIALLIVICASARRAMRMNFRIERLVGRAL
jgi:hypothetical protein